MSFQLSGSGPEIYETTLVPLWFGRWATALLDLADLQTGDAVLDVACGTGVTTRLAADAVGAEGRVVGLDINKGMLDAAELLAEGRSITWMDSDVTGITLADDSFDAILSQHGYHYFPDKPAALQEFYRLLRKDGQIALSIWDGHSAYTRAICDAVETHIGSETAQQQRSQRDTPTASDLIAQLKGAGFRDVAVTRQELQIAVPEAATFVPLHLGAMPIAAAFEALDDAEKSALVADVAAAMTDHAVGDLLIYSDAVHVVHGRK